MPWTGCVTWHQECPSCAHRPWGVGKLTLLLYHVKISAQTGYLYSVGSPLQCSCLENPRYRGAWWAAVYGVAQSRTRLKRRSSSSSSSRHNSGEGTGTHSSTLAWNIPWTEEPGGLQSMGSLRVGQDWETSLSLFTFMHWRRKWRPTPVFLPGESQERGRLLGCRLWGRTESDTTEAT